MYEPSLEARQSIFDSALHPHPSRQLLLSSAQAGWPNLLAQHYHYASEHTHLSLGPLLEDTILIPLCGAGNLSGKVVHSFPPQRIQPGGIFIVPRHLTSEWQWTAPWEALHLYLAPPLLAHIATDALGSTAPEVQLNAQIGMADALLYQLGLALLAELQASGMAGPHYVTALTQTLALHLLRNHAVLHRAPPTPAVGLAPHTLRGVFDYIQSHLAHPLSQVEVAAIAHVSPHHFARLFRQATGQSLHQYILMQRVAAAECLLMAGHLTLAEIALQVGFTDQSHLTHHFKRQCGVTPKRFAQVRTNLQHERTILLESAG
jgi:AraC family transcriptional regulator